MITLYGISNCDTVRKARKWLEVYGIDYHFHDFRKDGLTRTQLDEWIHKLGWESLLNRKGTSWRKLDENQKESLDQNKVADLLLANPALIKRPLLDTDGNYHIGFTPTYYETLFE